MKLLVAADAADLDAHISRRFGHAEVHIVLDDQGSTLQAESGKVEVLPDHGIHRFADLGLEGVVTGNIGPHAFEQMRSFGLNVYIARGVTVREAVRRVHSGEIEPAVSPTMAHSIGEGKQAGSGSGGGSGSGRRQGQRRHGRF